jgi:NAD(P)-dependent dehydrogenase (short-subunit alcohol dehydrogenase family)
MRLSDKVAIVTGSSRSIGRAIAIGFAREGALVVVNYRTDADAAGDVVSVIEAAGGTAIAVRADVSKRPDVERLVAATIARYGRVDVLVNNAAILKRTPFLEISEDEWDEIISINLKGYFLCAQAVAREMVKRRSGVIVNMSSASEELAGINLTHYCCA